MKKLILSIVCIVLAQAFVATTAFAGGQEGSLTMRITDPVHANRYFFCIYGIGCMSIQAADHGKTFPVDAPMDMGNNLKFVITNVDNMEMYAQPTDPSCNVVVQPGQKITISGHLEMNHNAPSIKGLHCTVTA